MLLKKYIDLRNAARVVRDRTEELVCLVKPSSMVNVPFIVDGSPMEFSKKVPFEPIKAFYNAFDNDFMLSNGYVDPIVTFRSDVNSVLNSLTPEFIDKLLTPAQTEQTKN